MDKWGKKILKEENLFLSVSAPAVVFTGLLDVGCYSAQER